MTPRLEVLNLPERLCLRPNPARDDGVWPGGAFFMVGNTIYFHEQDAEREVERLRQQGADT